MVGKRFGLPSNTPRKHKYGATGVRYDGHYFPSKAEGRRYLQLKPLLAQNEIRDLELQPRFPIYIDGKLVCTYVADFRYFDNDLGETIVEDVKGFKTAEYKLKKKLVEAVYKIRVTEL